MKYIHFCKLRNFNYYRPPVVVAGFEPSILGLRVKRFTSCATRAIVSFTNLKVLPDCWSSSLAPNESSRWRFFPEWQVLDRWTRSRSEGRPDRWPPCPLGGWRRARRCSATCSGRCDRWNWKSRFWQWWVYFNPWDQKVLGQKFGEFIEWNSNIVFRVYCSPSHYEVLVSTEYASLPAFSRQ